MLMNFLYTNSKYTIPHQMALGEGGHAEAPAGDRARARRRAGRARRARAAGRPARRQDVERLQGLRFLHSYC